jgi:small subunit ribosomal protein S20e
MSYQKPEKDFGGEGPKTHKIRITLTSRKVQSLEKVCTELLERAKSKNLRVKGPVRLPTKVLKVCWNAACASRSARVWDIILTGCDRSRPARRPVVKVPRRGIPTRCAFTSA